MFCFGLLWIRVYEIVGMLFEMGSRRFTAAV